MKKKEKETLFYASFKANLDGKIINATRLDYFEQDKTKQDFIQWVNEKIKEIAEINKISENEILLTNCKII